MKKGLVLLFAAAVLGGCHKNTLSLFTWAEMFPQDILDGFERDTGIKINYVNFDYNETMLTRLETSRGFDLIMADDYIIETVIDKGLAAKLDRGRLKNYGNINPVYQNQFYDPGNGYTVPYGAGVQTIVYNPARISLDITGYAGLLNPALAGRLGIIDNYRVVNGLGLKILGKSYNTENLADIAAAGDILQKLAPNIRLIRDDGLENDLVSGEIDGAVMYTSQVTAAVMENPALKVVYPEEGIGFGIMNFFIPAGAPNPAAAYAFIDYVLDPRRGAECFEFIRYYSTYSASDPLIKSEYRGFLTLPEGFNTGMEMIKIVGTDADEEHTRVYTAFKEAAGR